MSNKNQYFRKHSNLRIKKEELERKWRVFKEQEEMEKLLEMFQRQGSQTMPPAAGGGGGGFIDLILEGNYVEDYFNDYTE